MTSGLEMDWEYSGRMGWDEKARKYMKCVRKGKK